MNGDLGPSLRVRAGDVWQLGDHRLVCGDSTFEGTVGALMRAEQADLMVTDPPYGVRYRGSRLVRRAIRNDDLAGDRLHRFLVRALSIAPLRPGASFYICAPSGPSVGSFLSAAAEAGLGVHQALVWVKNHFVLSRSDYHYRHELILYGWKPGAPHYYAGGRRQHTVWEFDKPHRSPLHPTSKPLGLIARAVCNNSRGGDIVFDGFCGAGTTLIACEHTGRRCRAVEIEPMYCEATIRRFEEATGQSAILLSRDRSHLTNADGGSGEPS